jgi:hypothetical protein
MAEGASHRSSVRVEGGSKRLGKVGNKYGQSDRRPAVTATEAVTFGGIDASSANGKPDSAVNVYRAKLCAQNASVSILNDFS